jgi:hypothetical protein
MTCRTARRVLPLISMHCGGVSRPPLMWGSDTDFGRGIDQSRMAPKGTSASAIGKGNCEFVRFHYFLHTFIFPLRNLYNDTSCRARLHRTLNHPVRTIPTIERGSQSLRGSQTGTSLHGKCSWSSRAVWSSGSVIGEAVTPVDER